MIFAFVPSHVAFAIIFWFLKSVTFPIVTDDGLNWYAISVFVAPIVELDSWTMNPSDGGLAVVAESFGMT